jgi:hypothetical protein
VIVASPTRRHIALAAVLFALTVPTVVVAAVAQIGTDGATVSEPAVRLMPPVGDLVAVYDGGSLDTSTEARAVAAAREAGADFAIRGAASIAMQRIVRGTTVVQQAPSTMSIPMGTTVFDVDAISAIMGAEAAAAVSATSLVMSRLTADLRGAQAGDIVTLRSSVGADVDFSIGAVIADEVTGGTELLITPEGAERLNFSRRSSVVLWGFGSRTDIERALADNDLVSTNIRIRRSWELFDPDSSLGVARTKELLGEFAYRVNSDGSVTQEASWRAANLPPGRRLLNSFAAISARCHLVIEPALREAFAEIASVGAHTAFDLDDANTAGGCHNPRFNRLANSTSIGFLSRHSWGMAIDTNTQGACQGCAPPNFVTRPGGCTAVRIMRKHGFAWGGNYLTPDGMHFEYVGEPRDQLPYPSRYCPNIVEDNALTIEITQRATLFDDAGLVAE